MILSRKHIVVSFVAQQTPKKNVLKAEVFNCDIINYKHLVK